MYVPRVRAWNVEQPNETECGTITVAENEGPEAAFEYVPDELEPGSEISFDASASVDPDGEIVEYRWDFGDGATGVTEEPETIRAYDEMGSYQVTLTVADDDGATRSVDRAVVVVGSTELAGSGDEEEESVPWVPIGLGVGSVLGLWTPSN